ncbi:hypothetical protein N331_00469, partial [Merops nubicus]
VWLTDINLIYYPALMTAGNSGNEGSTSYKADCGMSNFLCCW